jgi:hypothetical protein
MEQVRIAHKGEVSKFQSFKVSEFNVAGGEVTLKP